MQKVAYPACCHVPLCCQLGQFLSVVNSRLDGSGDALYAVGKAMMIAVAATIVRGTMAIKQRKSEKREKTNARIAECPIGTVRWRRGAL